MSTAADLDRRQAGARRGRRRGPERSWRAVVLVAGGVLVCSALLLATLWQFSPVRAVLQQSFTKQPERYTELYFTTPPVFDGATVQVPVSVVSHGNESARLEVVVELESAGGIILSDARVRLTTRGSTPASVLVRVKAPPGTSVALVTLPGHPQTLHYRLDR